MTAFWYKKDRDSGIPKQFQKLKIPKKTVIDHCFLKAYFNRTQIVPKEFLHIHHLKSHEVHLKRYEVHLKQLEDYLQIACESLVCISVSDALFFSLVSIVCY